MKATTATVAAAALSTLFFIFRAPGPVRNKAIAATDTHESTNDMSNTHSGFISVITSMAVPSELSGLIFSPESLDIISTAHISDALIMEALNPAKHTKASIIAALTAARKTMGALSFLNRYSKASSKMPMCRPLVAKRCDIPSFEKSDFISVESALLFPVSRACKKAASSPPV